MSITRFSWRRTGAALAAVAAAAALFPAAAGAAPATATVCDGSWRVAPSPSPGASSLTDVHYRTGSDGWAVGSSTAPGAPLSDPLVLHDGGTGWTAEVVPVGDGGFLNGVWAAGRDDVWAVGGVQDAAYGLRMLAMHRHRGSWSAFAMPPLRSSVLNAVHGTGPTDVWAVGASRGRMVTVHYNGDTWEKVPTPDVSASYAALYGIVARTPTSAWAVGSSMDDQGVTRPLSLFWNGSRWESVAVGVAGEAVLTDVTVSDAGEVWAVGNTTTATGAQPLALVRRDGAWVSPAPLVADAMLIAVAPLPDGRLVAVGLAFGPTENDAFAAVYRPGAGWRATPTPDVPEDDVLRGVATLPGRDASVAVGSVWSSTTSETLVERRCR